MGLACLVTDWNLEFFSSLSFRLSRFGQLAIAVLVCCGPVGAAEASYPYVPRQVRLLESDLVILGTVETLETETEAEQPQQTIAKISVERTLKGEETGETVNLSFQSGLLALSAPQPDQDKQGTRGVWILSRTDDENYQALAAEDFVAESEIHAVEEDLRVLDDLVWSQPNNGLEFASIVEVNNVGGREVWIDGRLVPAQATVAIFPVVKNTSEADLKLCNFSADHPFVATWSRKGSQDWQPQLYSAPKANSLEPEAMHFQQIAPSEIQSIGHGFVLPPLLNEGEYTLSVTFTTNRTEKNPQKNTETGGETSETGGETGGETTGETGGETDGETDGDVGKTRIEQSVKSWTGTVELPKFELNLPLDE